MKRNTTVIGSSFLLLLAAACQDPAALLDVQPNIDGDLVGTAAQEGAVVNGRQATSAEFYSTVALSGNGGPFCTGTLIAPRVVVTAAHCLEGQSAFSMEIVSGTLNAFNANNNQRFGVAALVTHPSYGTSQGPFVEGGAGNTFDIGMVLLSEDVDNIVATPVLPGDDFDATLQDGTEVTVTGYGINNLNTGSSGVLFIGETPYRRRSDSEFVAGGLNLVDSCNGDSGGPVYVASGGVRYLIGATSRAASNSNLLCGGGGVYSAVPAFTQWMIDSSQGLYDGTTDGGGGIIGGDGDGDGDGGGGQCDGFCGGQSTDGCYCDDECTAQGDCCADYQDTCLGGGDGDGDGDTGGAWTCDPTFQDANDGCDCGCGVLDGDCADATFGSCQYQYCPDGELPNATANWLCGDDVPGGDGDGDGDSGDGDGDGDTTPGDTCGTQCTDGVYSECTCGVTDPCGWSNDGFCDDGCAVIVDPPFNDGGDCGESGDGDGDGDGTVAGDGDGDGDGTVGGDGDGDGDAPVIAGWTCDNALYWDGQCDCGCGVADVDCGAEPTADKCEREHCPDGTAPSDSAPEQCVEDDGSENGENKDNSDIDDVDFDRDEGGANANGGGSGGLSGGCNHVGGDAPRTASVGFVFLLGLVATTRRRRR